MPNTKDIFVDDLHATLEAHRATNRAALIRKVEDPTPKDMIRLKLGSSQKTKHEIEHLAAGEQRTAEKGDQTRDMRSVRERLALNTQDLVKDPVLPANPETEDYVGLSKRACGFWKIEQHEAVARLGDSPWLEYIEDFEGEGMNRLSHEIKAFEAYMRPTPGEAQSVEQCIHEVTRIVTKALPSNPLTMHGSRFTGLAAPHSDIDFRISIPEYEKDLSIRGPSASRPEARKASRRVLRVIARALQRSRRYSNIEFVWGRLPLITAKDNLTGLELQFLALAPVLPAREYSANYLAEFYALRPLFVLLRHALDMRNLTTVYEGGLGSYPLLMMIVTALKHAPGAFARNDLAGQLLHVLNFYATADLYTYGFSADPPRIFPKKFPRAGSEEREGEVQDRYTAGIGVLRKESQRRAPWLLCLQDPADPVNDLGKKAFQIKHIQATFASVRAKIVHSMALWEECNVAVRKMRRWALLAPLVRAKYQIFAKQRRRLARAHMQEEVDVIKQLNGGRNRDLIKKVYVKK